MSIISKLNKDLSNLQSLLSIYDSNISDWENNLKLKGKNLETANAEQPAWNAYYDQLRVELNILLKYMDMRVKQTRSATYKKITDVSTIDLTEKSKDRMIDNDPAYVKIYEAYLEVDYMYSKVNSIVQQFDQRSYTLTNIVKIRTHNLENAHIDINE